MLMTEKYDTMFKAEAEQQLYGWPNWQILKAVAVASSGLDERKRGGPHGRAGLMGLTVEMWRHANMMLKGRIPHYGTNRCDAIWSVKAATAYLQWCRVFVGRAVKTGFKDPDAIPTWMILLAYYSDPKEMEHQKAWFSKVEPTTPWDSIKDELDPAVVALIEDGTVVYKAIMPKPAVQAVSPIQQVGA